MKTFGERLKYVRGSRSQAEFAALFGIPQVTLGNYERNRNEPRFELIQRICLHLEVDVAWLLFGTGPMHTAAPAPFAHTGSDGQSPPADILYIPLVEAMLPAGGDSFAVSPQPSHVYPFRRDFIASKGQPTDMVLMRVSGDSMSPDIWDGDMVLIDQSKRDIAPGKLFAVAFEKGIYLKRLDYLPGKLVLSSANPACPPVELDVRAQQGKGLRILGRVLWVGRELE